MGHNSWRWHELDFRAMNTEVTVRVHSGMPAEQVDSVVQGVASMFAKAEQNLTRFESGSELSRLNHLTGCSAQVNTLVFDAVEAAVWAAQATYGLFDPTLLRPMQSMGYDRSFDLVKSGAENGNLPPGHDLNPASEWMPGLFRQIQLNRPTREIFLPSGAELDLGGIGKGWTVDRATDWLAGIGPFLLNAGGDLYAYGTPPGCAGWHIGIIDPRQPEQDIAHLTVRQRAVATSTTTRRQWWHSSRHRHHLVDPRTGQSAQSDAISVTVVAHRVAIAEVCAKAALVLGVEAGLAWLNSLPEIDGLIVRKDGQMYTTYGLEQYIQEENSELSLNQ